MLEAIGTITLKVAFHIFNFIVGGIFFTFAMFFILRESVISRITRLPKRVSQSSGKHDA